MNAESHSNAPRPSSLWSAGFQLVRRRRGSVLILVIVLLVMLALIGTAYVSSSRTNRQASQIGLTNLQIEQVQKGANEIALAAIADGATDKLTHFRPPSPPSAYYTGYFNYDAVIGGNDLLAPRVPELFADSTGKAYPGWRAITRALGPSGAFESPNAPGTYTSRSNPAAAPDNGIIPTFLTVNGVSYPALQFGSTATSAVLAADADGDGIADAGLVRLPGTSIDGLTYYAGFRIIDNNSAINVNTAWSVKGDFAAADPPYAPTLANLGLFTSNVGLLEMLDPNKPFTPISGAPQTTGQYQMECLAQFRNGYDNIRVSPTSTQDIYNSSAGYQYNVPILTPPVDDLNPLPARPDYAFMSVGDAYYHQVGRRLGHPGYSRIVSPSIGPSANPVVPLGTYLHFSPISDGDGADLASGFVIKRSYAAPTFPNALPLDVLLGNAVAGVAGPFAPANTSVPYNPYTPETGPDTNPGNWFNLFFDYDNDEAFFGTTPAAHRFIPKRPLLVTRNTLSNVMPADPAGQAVPSIAMLPYGDRGPWRSTLTYAFGDIVTYGSTSGYWVSKVNNNYANTPPTTPAAWMQPTLYDATVTYNQGDIVYFYNPTNFTGGIYASLKGGNVGQQPDISPTSWSKTGTSSLAPTAHPPRANANTASFAELFRAYWGLISSAANPGESPFGPYGQTPRTATTVDELSTYMGMGFTNAPPFTPTPPAALPAPQVGHRHLMFRSPIRDPRTLSNGAPRVGLYLDPGQMMQLRAAIAAVNAESLRTHVSTGAVGGGKIEDVQARQIPLVASLDGVATPVTATVYGVKQQPYITEVYCQNDMSSVTVGAGTLKNDTPYVAIELYNPYNVPIPLGTATAGNTDAWSLWAIDRHTATAGRYSTAGGLLGTTMCTFVTDFSNGGTPIVIPANGYLLIENYQASASPPNGVNYRPPSSGLPPIGPLPASNGQSPRPGVDASGNPITLPPLQEMYVANLAAVLDHEMLLAKRRAANGTPQGPVTDGTYTWNDRTPATPTSPARLYDLVPVDSYDFSGFPVPASTSTGPFQVWHYVRGNSNSTTPSKGWHHVYPGRYDASQAEGPTAPRQQGTESGQWTPAAGPGGSDPGIAGFVTPPSLGATIAGAAASNANSTASYPESFPIQLAAQDWAGPNVPVANGANGNTFPFGGYARNGDILEAPYIGSYRITVAGGTEVLEINAVTMDASFAEDTDVADDADEQIGRFCPIIVPNQPGTYAFDDALNNNGPNTRYGWARDFFSYLTVQSPNDDYAPNANPVTYPGPPAPSPIANQDGSLAVSNTANGDAERNVGIDGLVNINTAPWPVLAQLPMVINASTGQIDMANNILLARAIVQWRAANGPFRSIFDLNRVTQTGNPGLGFQNAYGTLALDQNPANDFGYTLGDLSPYNPTGAGGVGDGVRSDYEEKYLVINRLSNLITTRSDTFTVYVDVEGWQNAGTASATRVTQRRSAFIVDRSQLNGLVKTMKTVTVPTD